MSKEIKTKFGKAKIDNKGYWCITTSKEGNHRKFLHRLIYEDYYKVTLLNGVIIHHKDGNKLNNNINNLEAIYRSEHQSLHAKGRKHSTETKEKISKIKKGIKRSKESINKQAYTYSKKYTSTGFFRVSKSIKNDVNKGFVWTYSYPNGAQIVSVDLNELEVKVKEKGLEWLIINESKAQKSMKENNSSLPKYSHGGKHSHNYIPYAVINKGGYRNGKWNYRIRYKSKEIKQSIYPNKLVEWFTKEYPNVILHLRIYEEMLKK